MDSIIITPGIEELVEFEGRFSGKIEIARRLAGKIDRELIKTRDIAAWIHSTQGNDNCYWTGSALRRSMSKALPVQSEEEITDLSSLDLRNKSNKLIELDEYMQRYAKSEINPQIFVVIPEVANFYPTHFWHDVLKQQGSVGPLKEAQAVMFSFYLGDLSQCSCKLIN